MLSLAGLRYRCALAVDGGPIERIDMDPFPMFGRQLFQANATLIKGLVPRSCHDMYGNSSGTGTHKYPIVASHIAVSEAIERWAYHITANSNRRSQFGFDEDESTNGIAAFPGWNRRSARKAAVFEAYERHCLLNWWDGRIDGKLCGTAWPGITAVVFEPLSDIIVAVLFGQADSGAFIYGHAAAETFSEACKHAGLELMRHERAVRGLMARTDKINPLKMKNKYERRALFFSTGDGYEIFCQRLSRMAFGPAPKHAIICDDEIEGPWTKFATVWRFALSPPSKRFVLDGDDYFFW